jgi:hypothetical protein
MIQTEYPFTLPVGYQDSTGNLHREGVMRLATAGDEILPLKDPRVQNNEAYLIVILLSRVVSYPLNALYEEVAFIAYHFHWPLEAILNLEHPERRRWVQGISTINQRMNREGEDTGGHFH